MPTLLATKQKKGESIKMFMERIWSITLRYPSGMTQSTLVETCCHNLQTTLLAQIGVTQSPVSYTHLTLPTIYSV